MTIGAGRGRVLFLIAVGLGVLWVAYRIQAVLNPLLLALLIAYVLNPIVDHLERRGVPRTATICGLYLLLYGGAALAIGFAVPVLWKETVTYYQATVRGDSFNDLNKDGLYTGGEPLTEDLNSNARYDPAYVDRWTAWAERRVAEWNDRHPKYRLRIDSLQANFEKTLEAHAGAIAEKGMDVTSFVAGILVSGLTGAYTVLSYLVLVPIYLFFFLRGLHDLYATVVSYFPPAHRDRILQILGQIHVTTISFFRGKLVVCIVKGLFVGIGLWICSIPFPLVYGAIEGVGSLIPFLPLIVGWIPCTVTTALDAGIDPMTLGLVSFWFLGAEVLEAFVLNPIVLGKETGLHPVTLIVVLLAGAQLFGLFGVLLAVPVACIVKILGREILLPMLREMGAAGAARA
ncbi:MAG: AI-2E family transporter [Planctomycetes bacterium]|nr:AI-2E family transporter [Planctomycetota bacterium]